MLQIRYQPLEVQLLMGILGLADEQVPVAVDEAIEVGVVIQSGGNQSLITAVRLVVDVKSRRTGVLIQQPVEGG